MKACLRVGHQENEIGFRNALEDLPAITGGFTAAIGGLVADLAARILDGTQLAWALTERDHGSDLLASELAAAPVAGGFQLTGEKWLINNATRGTLLCLLVRTRPEGGPRGFSLLLADKRRLPADRWLNRLAG